MGELSGKVALITGGTAGIGKASVERFVLEGAQVVFTGTNSFAGNTISKATGATFYHHDVTDADGWKTLQSYLKTLGSFDIAFANAGVNSGDDNIESVSLEAWHRVFSVNVDGAFLMCKSAIELMKENPNGPRGSIVINSSIAAMAGLAGDVAYTSSKGALRSMTKSIAIHCAKNRFNIRCNSIHPGITETPTILKAIENSGAPQASREYLEGVLPVGRFASPAEIADVVCYLASDRSSYVTGAEWVIDGGATSGLAGL